jgi:hyperosmotically inducible protein
MRNNNLKRTPLVIATAAAALLAFGSVSANDPATAAQTERTANTTDQATRYGNTATPTTGERDAYDRTAKVNEDGEYESRDSDQPVNDTWITTKVKSELLMADEVEGTHINVTTVNGEVTLAGALPTQAAVDKAIQLTRAVEGVTSVDTRALKVKSS